MRTLFYLATVILLSGLGSVNAQTQQNFSGEIRQVATKFIGTLSDLQQRSLFRDINDTARIQWNNLPVGMRARAGLSIGNMTDEQRMQLHRLLSVSLSSQGYLKATSIMHLDNLLNNYFDTLLSQKKINEGSYKQIRDLQWSHRNFYLAFFGKPSDPAWGYKIEGHHLSVNFSFANDNISVTPFFIGTDPAEYPIGEYAGWRVLGQEQDLGIKLIQSLSPAQQIEAVISNKVPADIITAAESGIRLIDYQGIRAGELNKQQKSIIQQIIREYVYNFEFDKANMEYDKIIKAGIDNIYFAWIGPLDEYKPHYFVLNGPNFLIEFDNNGFGRGNHIHTIWREKGNDFGEDLLRKHYQTSKH